MSLDTRTMPDLASEAFHPDLQEVLYTAPRIQARVREMAAEILRDYRDRRPLMVGVLNGCFPFMADIVRAMDTHLEVDFMSVSSYGGGAQSSGVVRILKDLNQSIQNRHVLLV